MKKNICIAALFLLALGSSAHAVAVTEALPGRFPEPATKVTTVKSSGTVTGLSISSFTPTSIIVDTTQMFSWVEVQNSTGSCSLYCGENANAISTQTATLSGWQIPPSTTTAAPGGPNLGPLVIQSKRFEIIPGRNFYCQNGCLQSTRAIIYRGR